MKLFPSWEAVKLESNPFSEDNFLVFFGVGSGTPFNPALGCMCLFLLEAPADLETTRFRVYQEVINTSDYNIYLYLGCCFSCTQGLDSSTG